MCTSASGMPPHPRMEAVESEELALALASVNATAPPGKGSNRVS